METTDSSCLQSSCLQSDSLLNSRRPRAKHISFLPLNHPPLIIMPPVKPIKKKEPIVRRIHWKMVGVFGSVFLVCGLLLLAFNVSRHDYRFIFWVLSGLLIVLGIACLVLCCCFFDEFKEIEDLPEPNFNVVPDITDCNSPKSGHSICNCSINHGNSPFFHNGSRRSSLADPSSLPAKQNSIDSNIPTTPILSLRRPTSPSLDTIRSNQLHVQSQVTSHSPHSFHFPLSASFLAIPEEGYDSSVPEIVIPSVVCTSAPPSAGLARTRSPRTSVTSDDRTSLLSNNGAQNPLPSVST